ncbi:cyclic nucleotide-binding domain-containing protein [Lyngbya sp. CCY1209]|jgi:CRP-like cAMP-binding protein|uniref:cyclic nucleotide-binding domain-containing protein n=1 Tax=Lyngbya sp. CCY1209 TaxID=2886103 RepID=UPI002D2121C4|nr:cyclic nucleotide-binding domain-containing protein [Lyngbya sp. CCY1209]MEB3882728.1 cyclic nucleotide-binding domain-containing protein [Lyngbya sp. CCY1209]
MLEPAQTVKIFQQLPDQKVSAGETIFEEGKPGDLMYGIIEGEVEFWVNGKSIETLKQGDVFGEGALVHRDGTRASTAVAKTDCVLATMDERRFLFAIEQTPLFALEVMRSFSDRLRRLKRSL